MWVMISARDGFGFFARSSAAFMICPDWQYPHCGTSSTSHAFCNGCEDVADRPSMVRTLLPATEPMSIWHERWAVPSTWMVQAPQRPAPQPYLVPVKPTWSRIAHNSGVLGSASTETCRLFKVNETMLPPPECALPHPQVYASRPD